MMACNLQRSLRMRAPFRAARSASTTTAASKTSVIRSIQLDIKNKVLSAEEVVKQYLATIARMEPTIGSYITVNDEHALSQV